MMPSLQSKVCIVTGANSGIGLETARALAQRQATVVMLCRNRKKGEAAQRELQQSTGNTRIHLFIADLSSQQAIRSFAASFRQQFDQLDVLVNNAGVFMPKREETEDGIEKTFAVNHLAYFLLTHLLLDFLLETAGARVVNVSSDAHRGGGALDLDDLELKQGYTGYKAYARSKLANIHFTTELARRLNAAHPDKQPTANCLHPGVVATNITTGKTGLFAFGFNLFKAFFMDATKGAQTSIYLATDPAVSDVTGKYFEKGKPVAPSREAQDQAAAKRLYDISAKLTGLEGITDRVPS